MGENVRFKNGHAHVGTRVFKTLAYRNGFCQAMVDSVSVRLKTLACRKNALNIRIQWNTGTACVSECVLRTLASRGLRVGPSKLSSKMTETHSKLDLSYLWKPEHYPKHM